MGYWILDDQGEPVPADSILAWGAWMEAAERSGARIVARTEVGPLTVSTVFLAVDHSHALRRRGRPILYETMIFGADDAEYQERYATRSDAEAGHLEAVKIAELYETSRAGGEVR